MTFLLVYYSNVNVGRNFDARKRKFKARKKKTKEKIVRMLPGHAFYEYIMSRQRYNEVFLYCESSRLKQKCTATWIEPSNEEIETPRLKLMQSAFENKVGHLCQMSRTVIM